MGHTGAQTGEMMHTASEDVIAGRGAVATRPTASDGTVESRSPTSASAPSRHHSARSQRVGRRWARDIFHIGGVHNKVAWAPYRWDVRAAFHERLFLRIVDYLR